MNHSTTSVTTPLAGKTLDLFAPYDHGRMEVPVFAVRLVRERSHETAVVRTPADAVQVAQTSGVQGPIVVLETALPGGAVEESAIGDL